MVNHIRSTKFLWLAFERIPHPEAVSYPANVEDLDLILYLLNLSEIERKDFAGKFKKFLEEQAIVSSWQKKLVPCRGASGLYQLVPWRLAKWLVNVLPASDWIIEKTRKQIEHWLDCSRENQIVKPISNQLACR